MWFIKTSVLLTLLVLATSAPLNPKKVLAALNCGSGSVSLPATEGFRYVPDIRSVDGDIHEADYTLNDVLSDADIKYTFEKDVYMYERHTYKQMTYRLPVKQGAHTLILKFAEMYFDSNGKRVFDVAIGKKTIFKDMDVFAEVGKLAALDKYIEINVEGDKCTVNGTTIPGAIEGGKLLLHFIKGKADNPIIQGIIVYNAPLAESNYAQYKELRARWLQQKEMQKARKEEQEIRELVAIQKKREKIVIRNDQLDREDEEVEEAKAEQSGSSKGWIRTLLMSPLGVLGQAVAVGWAIVFILQNVFLMRQDK